MYLRYFGLQEEPFSIAPNPGYLYMSQRHKEALAHLLYGVNGSGGFVLLTGEVGTGKTTISRCLLEQLPDNTDIAFILNPFLNSAELLATICDEFDLKIIEDRESLKTLSERLYHFLLENHARGRNTVLLIDEAQHLQFEVLEQIRLLTNLETNRQKLLQIIFIGQPELRDLLAKPALRQLAQRITARFHIEPLNLTETREYIRHRLQVAGLPANQELFPQKVVKVIYRLTRGVPRLINILCDRTLLGTYAQNKRRVDLATLRQAAIEAMGDPKSLQKSEATYRSSPTLFMFGTATALLLFVMVLFAWQQSNGFLERIVALAGSDTGTSPKSETEDVTTLKIDVTPETVRSENTFQATEEAGSVTNNNSTPVNFAYNNEIFVYDNEIDAVNEILRAARLVEHGPRQPCNAIRIIGLQCEYRSDLDWLQFLQINRPAVLELRNPKNQQLEYLPVIGVSDTHVHSSSNGNPRSIGLAELGEQWTGNYMFIWEPPVMFDHPAALGDRADIVQWVAERFAEIDGQAEPLSDRKFNQALMTRVKLFQRENALNDDGIIGMKTLLKLNEVLGIAKITLSGPLQIQAAQNNKG